MTLYAILNLAAAVPLRLPVSKLTPPEGEPLLGRKEFADSLAVAPWVVDLDRCPAIAKTWRDQGRYKGWGYTFTSQNSLRPLVQHFKKFNLIQLEGKSEPVFFRYFDPKIFLPFMRDVANDEQYAAISKSIEEFFVEDAEKRVIVTIRG